MNNRVGMFIFITLMLLSSFISTEDEMITCRNYGVWEKDKLPISLYVHTDVPEEMYKTIIKSVNDFNKQTNQVFYRVEGVIDIPLDFCEDYGIIVCPSQDYINVIYYLPYSIFDVGRTRWYKTNTSIMEADIYINKNIQYNTIGSSVENPYLYSIMLHELAHGIGILHTDNKADIMYPSIPEDKVLIEFSKRELSLIRCNYKELYVD